ncbi:N-acetyl-D-Glu racemase DgcA [Luteimonas sp. R10]|uniref:N-acetyl-D-Glu racemase DgcA n=1 Tax=Luteimonas sp. R10 TaxID=3108176 RepID=UPI00308CA249|nr:N-acetyl-D-Glu racemase DgcA [Luteimonas sp. R10]
MPNAPLELHVAHEHWPLSAPFRISRGERHAADVVVVRLGKSGTHGFGESSPYPRYGETVASVIAQIERLRPMLAEGFDRRQLASLLPPGAARNAVDCALWDLESRIDGRSVSDTLRQPVIGPIPCFRTLSMDTVERMADTARRAGGAGTFKVKVDATDPITIIRAVRDAAPDAHLIVDPNESWNIELLQKLQPLLVENRVALVEQPIPAGQDSALEQVNLDIPVCADESCHTLEDLDTVARRYQAINIKLDKTGGLSAALDLLEAARRRGLDVMVGCMVCTSLSLAPALHVARHADFVDLDGMIWLRRDRKGGLRLLDGLLMPPAPGFWGDPGGLSRLGSA